MNNDFDHGPIPYDSLDWRIFIILTFVVYTNLNNAETCRSSLAVMIKRRATMTNTIHKHVTYGIKCNRYFLKFECE